MATRCFDTSYSNGMKHEMFSDEKGNVWRKSTQSAAGIEQFKQANREAATVKYRDMHRVGSIPPVFGLAWAREWGVKYQSREWLEKATKRISHDADYKHFTGRY